MDNVGVIIGWVGIAVGIVFGGGGIYMAKSTKSKMAAETKKTEVDAAAQISEAALAILKQAREDAEQASKDARDAREEMTKLRAEIRQLRDYLDFLERFIRENGFLPPTIEDMHRRSED